VDVTQGERIGDRLLRRKIVNLPSLAIEGGRGIPCRGGRLVHFLAQPEHFFVGCAVWLCGVTDDKNGTV